MARLFLCRDGYLPGFLYRMVAGCLPIVSVEGVIVRDGRVLLLRRRFSPARGEWWFPGGRVRWGEGFLDALRREVLEETGLEVRGCRFVGVYSRVFPERHDVTIVYLCEGVGEVRLNEEHSEYGFFDVLPRDLHPHLLEVIRDSGWRPGGGLGV